MMDKVKKKIMDSPEHYEGSSTPKRMKQEELEVTGISRSGRVRKKSSKLTDFESPDEIDRYRRKNEKLDAQSVPMGGGGVQRMNAASPKKAHMKPDTYNSDEEDNLQDSFSIKEEMLSESDSELRVFPPDDDVSSMDSMGSPGDDEDLDDPMAMAVDHGSASNEGFQRIAPETADGDGSPVHGSAQSLYMLEKSTKKKLIIRDGRIVGRMKAQRKDKGKTRFTAYMLWAKEIRQELMKANPELDFSQTSKRLGELWSTVPFNEKYIWKRRAKRLAAKGVRAEKPPPPTAAPVAAAQQGQAVAVAGKKVKSPPARKFINKQHQQQANSGAVALQTGPSSSTIGGIHGMSPPEPSNRSSKSAAGLVSEPVVGPGLYKVIGTTPIDVSAHLRLLGESLSIIGERLKEHDGQIAVSGSLSVLLDSLLCVLGPLLCLTQQVPETDVCPPQQLSKILDNIAYIMPGL